MSESILITADGVTLGGELEIPENPGGVVVFAHGTGSSRFSPRNRSVASVLGGPGRFATLLFDLLTSEEDLTYANRFDIGLLAERLVAANRAVRSVPELAGLPIGYFGASTGAAAAIVAAANAAGSVDAIVSRGGRPDLAGHALTADWVPTLLIVGGLDFEVIQLNEQALAQIPAEEKRIEIVPGATHLFEERGTLEQVSQLALDWFTRFLGTGRGRPGGIRPEAHASARSDGI
ncbi:MAG: dienelactone hydrolase family protein [Coriobacteriia bacterium]